MWQFGLRTVVCQMLYCSSMIAITAKVNKGGHGTLGTVMVPANHSEAHSAGSAWGLVIAGGLLFLTTTFICLLLFKA